MNNLKLGKPHDDTTVNVAPGVDLKNAKIVAKISNGAVKMRDGMSAQTLNLSNFEKQLADIVGRPTKTRPFVCDGSPLECQAFLVGYNPATDMSADFWDFWTEQGFDRDLWYAEYLRERATRPLKPGKTRRQKISSTRRMMDKVIEGAGIPILETNLYAQPSVDAKSLNHKDRRPFDFLLGTIQPKVVITHGDDAKRAMGEIQTSATVISVPHLSRGWSFDSALSLGQDIKNLVT